MENRREEIKGLKRLLVGVLVAALLITMLPFENMGTFVFGAEGELESQLKTGVLANAKVLTIVDTMIDDGQGGQTEYSAEAQIIDYLSKFNMDKYSEGLILKNGTTEALDFSEYSLLFPNGKVGLDLGEQDLIASNIDVSAMGTEEGAVQPYAAIYGGEGSAILGIDSAETSVWIGNNAQLEVNGAVNIDEVIFTVRYGQSLLINGEDFSVVNEEETRFYKENSYKILIDSLLQTTYYEELHDIKGESFDILGYECPVPEAMDVRNYVFKEGVIPEDMDILYLGNTYANPGTALRADYIYGLYNITGTEMTIYAVYPTDNNSDKMYAGYFNVRSESDVSFVVDGMFALEVRDDTNEWGPSTVSCSKITFAEGALRYTVSDDMGTVYNANKIYNETYIPISAMVPIYVLYNETTLANPDLESQFSYTYSENPVVEEDLTYIKAGTILTLTPVDGNVIYNINDGGITMLANSENIVYKPNGERVITIPSYPLGKGINFEIGTEEFVPDTEVGNYISKEKVFATIKNVDYYTEASSIMGYEDPEYVEGLDGTNSTKKQYDVALEGATEFSENGVKISAEGTNVTISLIVIDKTLQKTMSEDLGLEIISPSETYGMQKKLTYTYSMDLASPQINGVTATDGDGNTIELEGDWVSTDETPPDIAMVWLKGPVTFVTDSDETEGVEYRYNYGAWQSSNTIITDEEREGNWFEVRDAFDIATGRDAGSWYTNVGIDNTAPTIYYTDANYAPDGSEIADLLDSGDEGYKDYEGNLYLETNDYSASGVNKLTLQKLDNNVWVECNAELLQDENPMEYMYFIRPSTKDVTYKLEITDNVGNTKTYDSFTLKGYMQDISIEVTNNTGVYNQELTVNVRITNTSTTNSVDNLTYVIRESDTVFTPVSGKIETLAAGASHDITLNIPVGTDAGEYLSTLDIQYTSTGNLLENTIEKAYSQEITAVLEKADGEGTFSVENYYFGQPFAYTADSKTHQIDSIKLSFKDVSDETAEFTTEEPTEEGTYLVRAEFTGETNYKDFAVEKEFTISRKEATADMYTIPEADEITGWYNEMVVITATDGNTLSTEENGEFVSELRIEESTESYQFYIKTADGAITNAVELSNIQIDTEVPVISVLGADTTELVSGATYRENLHLDIQDAGIGLSEEGYAISLESDMGEILRAEDGTYYILQTTEDVTYTIVGKDALGNTVTYQNIVVKAYEKDIVVSIENTEGHYNAELAIQITIQNTGKDAIEITTLELDKEVSDSSFTSALKPSTLVAGQSYTGYVYLPAGTTAGKYSGMVNIDYTTIITGLEKGIDKSYTESISAAIAKIAGTGSITVEDLKYGEEFAYKAESATNGTEGVVLYFKESGNETAEYITDVPTQAGSYEVKAVFPANENYLEVIVTDTFTISRLAATTEMYSISAMDEVTGWYNEDVVITAKDGYTISTTEEGEFVDTLTISSSVESFTFYVKTETGIVTEAVVLGAYQIDKTAPEIAENEGIYAVETWWQSFLEIITFGTYEAETTQVEIKAHDEESGIANISYYISTEAITLANIDSVAEWTEGAEVSISKEDYEQFILYAKVENEAGLVTYLSTDGIKLGVTETPVEPEVPVQPEPTPPVEDDPIEDIIEEIVSKITGGKVSLKKGTPYQLDAGSWNVAGDETTYSGGITFYVDEEGEYEFTQN